jgi:hypothetical protein
LKIAENNARHKVVSAGRRAGKSYMGGVDKLLPEVFYTRPLANQLRMDGRKRIFWVVGPNFSDSEKEFRVIWNYLRRLEIPMDKPGIYNPSAMFLSLIPCDHTKVSVLPSDYKCLS